jgi:hypothetical protein
VTLISSIIADAFREGNILPLGRLPNTNQAAEALRLYNALLKAIYGDDAGEALVDWPLGTFGNETPNYIIPYSDYAIDHPTINQRLIATNTVAKTIYLTPCPQDGSRMGIADPFGRLAAFPVTLNANGRTIEATPTLVLNTNGLFREWFYRADLAQWVKLTTLLATDQNPFPDDFDSLFITWLAIRLNPRYGRKMDDQSLAIFKSERKKFVARYLQSQPLEADDSISWPFMSTQSYDQQREFSSNRAFNRGWYGGP